MFGQALVAVCVILVLWIGVWVAGKEIPHSARTGYWIVATIFVGINALFGYLLHADLALIFNDMPGAPSDARAWAATVAGATFVVAGIMRPLPPEAT